MSKTSLERSDNRCISECQSCNHFNACPGSAVTYKRHGEEPEVHLLHRDLRRGEHLYNAGSPVDYVDIVQEGVVKTFRTTADGDEQIFGFHFPGDLVGVENLYRDVYGSYSAAAGPAQVCRLPVQIVRRALQDSEKFRALNTESLAKEVLRLQNSLQGVRAPATARVVSYLLNDADKQSCSGHENQCATTVTRTDLGRHLALATETVSRIFTRLQRRGLLKLQGRQVQVVDREGLKEVGDEDIRLANIA